MAFLSESEYSAANDAGLDMDFIGWLGLLLYFWVILFSF